MIIDRLKVRIDISMPFQKDSPNRVKLQDPQQSKSFLKADLPSQRAFQNLVPLRDKFQIPSGAKISNYQSLVELDQ